MPRKGISSVHDILTSRWVLAVSIVLCTLLLFQLVKIVNKSVSVNKEITRLQEQSAELKKQQEELERLKKFLQTDYFAESEARTKFGYRKEGETAVVISEPLKETSLELSVSQPKEAHLTRKSNRTENRIKRINGSRTWWSYFFGP